MSITTFPGGGGGGGGGAALAGNANAVYLSSSCPTINTGTNCYFVNADVRNVFDGVWNNGSTTVTSATAGFCNGSTVPCAAGQTSSVGKTIFGTASCASQNPGTQLATLGAAATTISSVQSTTSVTVSVAATGTVAANGCLFYGTPDDANLSAAETTVNSTIFGCPAYILPNALMFLASAHWITKPSSCNGNNAEGLGGPAIFGQGRQGSRLVLLPTFNMASCTGGSGNVCFGGFFGQVWQHFSFFGGYNSRSGASSSKTMVSFDTAGVLLDVIFSGFGSADSSLIGLNVQGGEFYGKGIVSNAFGNTPCSLNPASSNEWTSIVESTCANSNGDSLQINGSGKVDMYGGRMAASAAGFSAVHFISGGTLNAYGTQIDNSSGGGNVGFYCNGSGGRLFIDGARVDMSSTATGTAILNDTANCSVSVRNSVTNSGASGNDINQTNGVIIDQGSNTYSGGRFSFTGGNVFGITNSAINTACTTGNFALTSGWGTSSVTSVAANGNIQGCHVTITGAAGAAGPVLTWTYPKAPPLAPSSCHLSGVSGTLTGVSTGTPGATTVAYTFTGTPSAQTYVFDVGCP